MKFLSISKKVSRKIYAIIKKYIIKKKSFIESWKLKQNISYFESQLYKSFLIPNHQNSFKPITIELHEKLLKRTTETWTNLGYSTPHWSVSTERKYKPENISLYERDFWRDGEKEVELFCGVLMRLGIDKSKWNQLDIFELGCGIGRISFPLSKNFGRIYAVDISKSHLELLNSGILEQEIGERIETRRLVSLENISQIPSYDIFYSIITLQHNPPPIQLELIKKSLNKLNKDGLFYFQLPTYIPKYEFEIDSYLKTSSDEMEMHAVDMTDVNKVIKDAGCDISLILRDNRTGPVYESHTFAGRKK